MRKEDRLSLNYKEINHALEEADLQDSFLQEIVQFDFHHLQFQFYKPGSEKQLLVSLTPGSLRLHLTERRRKALPKPPRFTAYLKSHVKGARLISAAQIAGERIVRLELKKGDLQWLLYIKLWENNANLLLCDPEGTLLDCFSRRPKRKEVPGEPWDPAVFIGAEKTELQERDFPGEGSWSRRLELYYRKKEQQGRLEELKRQILPLLDGEISSRERRLKRAEKKQVQQDSLRWKEQGDQIMAHLDRIKKGDSWLELPEEGLRIQLDPLLEPWANGEIYYKRYKKKQREENRQNPEEEEKQLLRWRDLRNQIAESEEISFLEDWLKTHKEQFSRKKEPQVGLRFQSGMFSLLVGRNARENDHLLRHQVRGNDTWLHCRDYPGGYVFIRCPKGKSIPLEVLLDGGNLALKYSKASTEGRVDLHYTQVKYLRRTKNGPKGLVIPTQEKNLSIERDETRLKRLTEEADVLGEAGL